MAAFLLHMLLLSVFTGITARTDLLKPPPVTFAAAPAEEGAAPATSAEEVRPPRKIDSASLGVQLTAPTAALIDTGSGAVLYSQGDDRVVPIASITKLMTALVVLDQHPDWNKRVTLERGDNALQGIYYLKPGDDLSFHDMFDVMLTGSANNAAMALSRSVGMSRAQFVARMNSKARELGLPHTHFVDPTGYGQENRSAALEVARLAYAAFNHPEIRDALTRESLDVTTASGIVRHVTATDELLGSFLNKGDGEIVGGKTGFTDEAGYTLVLRAKKGKADLIAVVLGSANAEARFQDAKSLLFWGFKTFAW